MFSSKTSTKLQVLTTFGTKDKQKNKAVSNAFGMKDKQKNKVKSPNDYHNDSRLSPDRLKPKRNDENAIVNRNVSSRIARIADARVQNKKSQSFGLPCIANDSQRITQRCQAAARMMENKNRNAGAASRLGALVYDIMKSNELYRAADKQTTLTLVACRQLCRDATVRRYPMGQTVFKRGDRGSGMYLVLEGEATVVIGGQVKAVLGPGTSFGELSLILDQPRSATIVSKNHCGLMFIPRSSYVSVLKDQQDARFLARAQFLSKLTMFKSYSMERLKPMSILFKEAKFPAGHTTWRGDSDEFTDAVYFIRVGQCELRWYKKSFAEGGTLNGEFFRVCELGPYQCFGDIAFAVGRNPHIAVVTKTRVELWRLPFMRVEQLGVAKDALRKNALLKVKWQKQRVAKLKKNESRDEQISPKRTYQKPSLSFVRLEHARKEAEKADMQRRPKWSPINNSPKAKPDQQELFGSQKCRFAKRDSRVHQLDNVTVTSLVDDFNRGDPSFEGSTRRLAKLLNKHVKGSRPSSAKTKLPGIRTGRHIDLPSRANSMSPMRGSFIPAMSIPNREVRTASWSRLSHYPSS